MALYRNVAGAEALGLSQDYFTRDPNYLDDGGGGGDNYDLVPVRSFDPVEQSVPTVFYDPGYVPMPPSIAPDPVVIQPPPDQVYVTPTGATVQPPLTQIIYPTPGEIIEPVHPPIHTEQLPTVELHSLPTTDQPLKRNIWPLLTLAGVLLISVKGEDLFNTKRHVAFLGGLGALYYFMNKPPTAVTT